MKRKFKVKLTQKELLFLLDLLRDEMVSLKVLIQYTEKTTLNFAPNEYERKIDYKIKTLEFYKNLAKHLYHYNYDESESEEK